VCSSKPATERAEPRPTPFVTPLDGAAAQVLGVEVLRDLPRADGVVGQEQLQRERRAAHPSRRVDPRAELEADVAGAQGARRARHVEQRREAGGRRPSQHGQAVPDDHAVLADERHHVRDGPQHRHAQRLDQERAHLVAHARARRHVLRHGPGHLHGHSGAAEAAERVARVGPLRVDDRDGRRQRRGDLVVVHDHHVHAALGAAPDLFDGGGAVVHGDEERHALRDESLHGRPVEAVPRAGALRDVRPHVPAEHAQEAHQHRRAGDAVHVVVAPDADPLAVAERGPDARDGLLHVGQTLGAQQRGQVRTQELARRAGVVDAPVQQALGRDRVHAERSGQGAALDRALRADRPPVAGHERGWLDDLVVSFAPRVPARGPRCPGVAK
jgi:hypothetical protein